MEFLSPKILNMGIAEFKNTFCEYTTMTKRIGSKKIVREWINKYHNVDYLYSLIKHYVYECDLELAVKQFYIDIPYTIEPELKEQYAFLKQKYLDNEKMQALNNNIFLELTQKMQHTYCCSADKLTAIRHILRTNKPDKVLIFCKYLDSKAVLEREFPNIAVHTFGKSSFGLNLQNYNAIIRFDKTWDFAQLTQSEYRIFRTGQKKDCYYYDLTGDVPLENLINQNIEKKSDLLQYLKGLTIKELNEVL
jgi:SNF2 family DNA or RNA helicase